MRVAFSGSRDFTDRALVQSTLRRLYVKYPDLHVDVGDARGLDALVVKECGDHGIPFKKHYARWQELGKRAGHERNGRVIAQARILFAFFQADGTPGTSDAIRQAVARGITVYVWRATTEMWRLEGSPLPSGDVSGT